MTQDLVFQDMNTIGFDFEPWQPPQFFIYIYTYICIKTWHPKCWNVSFFATPCFQVLTMIALFKTWLFKSWILFGIINFHIRPNPELCLLWLGLPRHEYKWTWLSRLDSQLHATKSWHWLTSFGVSFSFFSRKKKANSFFLIFYKETKSSKKEALTIGKKESSLWTSFSQWWNSFFFTEQFHKKYEIPEGHCQCQVSEPHFLCDEV